MSEPTITTTHYEVLGIEKSAGMADVRRAYFRLAKTYHPDRQVVEDLDSTEKFLGIQRAYETLSDPEMRLAYDAEIRRSSAPPNAAKSEPKGSVFEEARKVKKKHPDAFSGRNDLRDDKTPTFHEARDARRLYQKAESLIENEDYATAVTALRAVVRAVPDEADYQSLYGYALALTGNRLHEARDACRNALASEPYNSEFHARLAYVYSEVGLEKAAEGCIEQALLINPKEPLALSLRAVLQPEPSFLGRLFGGRKKG